MKKVLFVVGSLREGSFNHQMAKQAEALLEGKAEVSYLDYTKLPLMNQDVERAGSPLVDEVRGKMAEADLIWIFSPVYNFSIPGTIKNLLDWASRSLDLSNPAGESAINQKLVTVSVVGNSGFERVVGEYQFLLPFIRTQIVGDFTTTAINPSAWGTGQLELSEETQAKLAAQAQAVVEALA